MNAAAVPVQVRPVEPGDWDAMASLVNPHITATLVHLGVKPTTGKEMAEEFAPHAERHVCLVALEGARVVGFAKSMPWRSRKSYDITAEVGLYVDPSLHRRGVGRALYARLFDELRTRGFHALVAGISLPNQASEALHARMGFTHVGVFREVDHKHGRHVDVCFWQRLL